MSTNYEGDERRGDSFCNREECMMGKPLKDTDKALFHKWVSTISILIGMLMLGGSVFLLAYDTKMDTERLLLNEPVINRNTNEISRHEYEIASLRAQMSNVQKGQSALAEKLFNKLDQFLEGQAKLALKVTTLSTQQFRTQQDIREIKDQIKRE